MFPIPICDFPVKLAIDGHSYFKVFGIICYFEEVASRDDTGFGWVTGHGGVDGLTFVWVEFHISFTRFILKSPLHIHHHFLAI